MNDDEGRVRLPAGAYDAVETSGRERDATAADDVRVLLDDCYTALRDAVANGGELDGTVAERLMRRIVCHVWHDAARLAAGVDSGVAGRAADPPGSARAALLDVVRRARLALEGDPADPVGPARCVVEGHRPDGDDSGAMTEPTGLDPFRPATVGAPAEV